MRTVFLSLISLILLTSCGSATRQPGVNVESKTLVRVENQRLDDMTIYLLQGAQRIRLGTVTAASTRVFVIPEYLITGVGSVRFLADPLGGRQTPISQEITVFPGEEVELVITN